MNELKQMMLNIQKEQSKVPDNLIENTLSEVIFSGRMSALQSKQKTCKRILPFVTEYRPSVPCLKHSYE